MKVLASEDGGTKCLSGLGPHSAVEHGCLPTAHSACPQRCGDECAGGAYVKDHP